MKILMINYSEVTAPGGVHKTITELAKNLSKMGHEVTVLQGNPQGLPNKETYEGFQIIRVESKIADYLYGFSPEIYFYLKKHFKELNPDIVHVHGYHTLFSPEVIYAIKRISPETPIVFSPHFDIFSHDKFAGKYLWDLYNGIVGRRFSQYPAITLVASNFEGKNVNQILKVPKEKIKVIAHGVDHIDMNYNARKGKTINLLFVGYLLELKGVQYIIEVIHELIYKNNVKICFNVVGEGPYEKELKKLAKDLKVDESISWKGFVPPSNHEKLLEYYKETDIFLLLSESENYGIVVAEALTMGTPVIITKRTALIGFLDEPGCFGVSYPPDPKEVADLILKIYRNDVQVGPFSKKIRTWDEVAEDYEKVYRSINTDRR